MDACLAFGGRSKLRWLRDGSAVWMDDMDWSLGILKVIPLGVLLLLLHGALVPIQWYEHPVLITAKLVIDGC